MRSGTTLVKSGLRLAAILAVSVAGVASAQQIGLKFGINGNGNQQSSAVGALQPSDSAGAPGFEQTQWNILGRWGDNNTNASGVNAYALLDSDGNDTHITIQWDSVNTYSVGDGGSPVDHGVPDINLMNTYSDSNGNGNTFLTNGLSNGIYGQNNNNKPMVYLSGLQAWLASKGAVQYDLVLYMDGDNQAGRTGEYWVQQASGAIGNLVFDTTTNVTMGVDMTTHVFMRDFNNFTGNPVFQEVSCFSNAGRVAGAGNYTVFKGLSADSLLVRTSEYNSRSGINAIQVVARTTAVGATIAPLPAAQTFAGKTATFRANVAGVLPFTYQWQKNGVTLQDGGKVSGATTATLKITDVSSEDAGSYTVVVTNPGGTSTSTASLTVLSAAPGSYAEKVATNSPVAYWQFNDANDPSTQNAFAYDSVGGFDAIYGPLAQNGFSSVAGPQSPDFPGFGSGNGALQTAYSATTPLPYPSSYVSWAVAPPLNLNTNTVTFCGWIYPTAYTEPGACAFIFNRNGNDTSGFGYGNNNNLGYTWTNSSLSYNFASKLVPASNQWSFVALVVSPTNAIIYLYNTDGQFSATNNMLHAVTPFAGQTMIGDDPNSTGTPQNRAFTGKMDEWAVFNRCLSDQELYSFYKKGLNVGIIPASISSQPRSLALYPGRTAIFKVAAAGDKPLNYQWRLNGVNLINDGRISGANSATLVITNVSTTDNGAYDVVVDNIARTPATSAQATLTVVAAPTLTTYESKLQALNPVAYWRFNEAAESVYAHDFWGGNIATNEAVTTGVAGPQPPDFPGLEANNSAYSYDGFAMDTDTGLSGMNNNLAQFSVVGWFNPAAPALSRAGLFGQNDVLEYGFHNADAQLGIWTPGGGAYLPQSLITPGQWYMTAAVGDGAGVTLYLLTTNGAGGFVASQASSSNSTTNYGSSDFPFRIGGGGILDATGNYFYGNIDEVAVFHRALSVNEVSGLFAAGMGLSSLAPQITVQPPASTTLYAGRSVSLSVSAVGSAPLYYQWRANGTPISDLNNIAGTGTATLTITNLVAANTANYDVVITNAVGSITSSVATVTVVPTASGSYAATVLGLNPLAYYRLNEVEDPSLGTVVNPDYAGGHAGLYAVGAKDGFNGIQGPRPPEFVFESTNTAMATDSNAISSYVTAPIGSLSTNLVTFTMWVKPTGTFDGYAGLLFNRNSGVTGGFCYTGGQLGYTWNNNNANTYNFRSGLVPPTDIWSFVTLVVTPTNAVISMYNANGVVSATNTVAHTADVFGNNWELGRDDINNNATDGARVFTGSIDEVAVFTYALTPAQLFSLYAAGAPVGPVTLDVQKSGSNLILTWPMGTLLEADSITGTWKAVSATSPYTVAPTAPAKFYRVQVR